MDDWLCCDLMPGSWRVLAIQEGIGVRGGLEPRAL